MRKFIAIVVLAIYSIVMAHGFIPHHHHSELEQFTHVCTHSDHDTQHNHQHELSGDCCVKDVQENNLHNTCSFDEKTLLAKSINLSNLYLPFVEIEFIGLENKIQSISDTNTPIQTTDHHCRDIELRGPPQFS